jgi:hypothetical protein
MEIYISRAHMGWLKKGINTHFIRCNCIRASLVILVGVVFFLEQYSYGLYFGNEIVMNDKSSLPQDPKVDIYQTAGSNHNIVYVVWSDNSTGNGDI